MILFNIIGLNANY